MNSALVCIKSMWRVCICFNLFHTLLLLREPNFPVCSFQHFDSVSSLLYEESNENLPQFCLGYWHNTQQNNSHALMAYTTLFATDSMAAWKLERILLKMFQFSMNYSQYDLWFAKASWAKPKTKGKYTAGERKREKKNTTHVHKYIYIRCNEITKTHVNFLIENETKTELTRIEFARAKNEKCIYTHQHYPLRRRRRRKYVHKSLDGK